MQRQVGYKLTILSSDQLSFNARIVSVANPTLEAPVINLLLPTDTKPGYWSVGSAPSEGFLQLQTWKFNYFRP